MQLHLCSRWSAVATAKRLPATHLISILDPGQVLQGDHGVPDDKWLRLSFHDIKHLLRGCIAPTREDAEQIVWLAQDLPEDAVLVAHCEAGISRSPAALILVMAARTPDWSELQAKVRAFFEQNPGIEPNERLIRAGDRVLTLHHELEELVGNLRKEYAAKAPIKDPNLAL